MPKPYENFAHASSPESPESPASPSPSTPPRLHRPDRNGQRHAFDEWFDIYRLVAPPSFSRQNAMVVWNELLDRTATEVQCAFADFQSRGDCPSAMIAHEIDRQLRALRIQPRPDEADA